MNMIIFNAFKIEEPLDKFQNYLFIIENKLYMYKVLNELCNLEEDNEFLKIINEKGVCQNVSNYCDFIPSLLNMDVNTKKNLSILAKKLKEIANRNLDESIENINLELEKCFQYIFMECSVDIKSNINVDEDMIIKNLNITLNDSADNLIEKINKYIKMTYELRNIKIFIFYNLSSLLSEEEITLLINENKYYDIKIIDLENGKIEFSCFDCTKIIDKDICLIE